MGSWCYSLIAVLKADQSPLPRTWLELLDTLKEPAMDAMDAIGSTPESESRGGAIKVLVRGRAMGG